MQLTPENVRTITWLPSTCAYRLVAEGKDLFSWHPLLSGRPESVHEAGISMHGRVTANETEMADPRTISTTCSKSSRSAGRIVVVCSALTSRS